MKLRAWEKGQFLSCFEQNLCPLGHTQVQFQFVPPADLPQTCYLAMRWKEIRAKLRWFFKAQLVPIDTELLNNGWGKSQIRDRQRIHVSPVQPIVNDPQFNLVVPFEKSVGLVSSKTARMQVTLSKNFFIGGEIAYLMVNIDNTQCTGACSLIISHKTKVKIYQNWRKYSTNGDIRKESFFLCGPGESKQLVLQFQIGHKLAKHRGPSAFGKHAADYYNVSTLVPESVFAQTFSIENYLELYLSHDGTVFSNDSKRKFYFQLIQPSLVQGIVEVAAPIFKDINGEIMNIEAPVIGQPEGECVHGTAMELDGGDKLKKEDIQEQEEPKIHAAQ